jgi:hypothetical protein
MANLGRGLNEASVMAKSVWGLIVVGFSMMAAIITFAIYVHDLLARVDRLDAQVQSMSQQLRKVSPTAKRQVAAWNTSEGEKCETGSVMVGAAIGSALNGAIICAKLQPAIEN